MQTVDNNQEEKNMLKSMRTRFASWLSKLRNKYKEGNRLSTAQETKQEKEIRENREALRKFIDEFKSQTSLNVDPDTLTNAINNFQLYETKVFESKGYEDGLEGVKDINISSSARARAAFIYDHTCSILEGKIKGLEDQSLLQEQRIKETELQISEEKGFNVLINNICKSEHRHFSWFFGFFYITIGISLMFADFPISLGIARYFIDLPIDFDGSFYSKIFNPEVLLFSLGITFLSIYFKILYDDYVNQSIVPMISSSGKAGTNLPQVNIARFIIKLLVLLFLIYLLYNIGSMRSAMNELSITSRYPNLVTEKQIFKYKLVSFVLTTVLLPLLSGICLSLGFGIVSNIKNLRTSNSKLNSLKDRKEKIEDGKTASAIQKNMLVCLRNEWSGNREEKLTNLSQLFANSYYQGHSRGFSNSFGNDIYDIAHSSYANHINSIN